MVDLSSLTLLCLAYLLPLSTPLQLHSPILHDSYYEHLNPMTSILDPDLHTKDWVRAQSPFLFSAIITVATKVAHPLHYVPALRHCKKLLGGAFEEGHNSIEFVQALAILVFWGEATDES